MRPPRTQVSQSAGDARAVLSEALTEIRRLRSRLESVERDRHEPIAVVGLSCRFPGGARSPQGLWQLLVERRTTVGELPRARWSLHEAGAPDMRFGSFLEDVESFDPLYFGISPREAVTMDPQQRLLLEVAAEALDSAGLVQARLERSRTGVFVGCCSNDYAQLLGRDHRQVDTHAATGVLSAVLSGRIAYLFGLEGPNLVLDTACSSSLVAVHLAVRSLRARECDVGLAAGVNLVLQGASNLLVTKLQALSPDGVCRTFDAGANGTVRGEGCGVLVLKRLSDALRDGDIVRALIRGTAVNQDGRSTSLTSPNVLSQQAVIREALADARVGAERVSFVETHGTGTALGDPIELEALKATYGAPRADASRCAIGALKTNLAHTEAAAGVAGVIKAILVLEHGVVPPNLHFTTLNPRVSLDGSALVLPAGEAPLAWPGAGGPRLAGVSAFGIGGTNAHVVLEQAPPTPERAAPEPRAELLVLSARSEGALARLASAWAEHLRQSPAPLADLAYTAAVRRTLHERRLVVVGRTREQLAEALRGGPRPGPRLAHARVALVFSGQGGQWLGMGRQLLRDQPVFRGALERADAVLRALLGWSVIERLHAPEPLQTISEIQPVLFAVQVALAELLRALGVTPAAVVGHSLGEAAAAHVAGALSLEDAAELVCQRSTLIETLRGHGDMALVALSVEEARQAIGAWAGEVSIAASNAPRTTVLSGSVAGLQSILAELEARGVFCRFIKAGTPGHSPQFEPLKAELVRRLAVSPRATSIPLYSTVLAEPVAGTSLDARYWGDNLRETVLFGPTIARMAADGLDVFVEVGVHPVLAASIEETLRGREVLVVPALRREEDERASLLGALGALIEVGVPVSVASLVEGQAAPLPSYTWDHDRYWIEPPRAEASRARPSGAHPLLGEGVVVATEPPAHVYEAEVDLRQAPFFADHRVLGSVVFPASGYLDLTWTAATRAFGEVRALEDVRFERLLAIKDEGRVRLQVVLTPRGGDRVDFHVASHAGPGDFVRHLVGVVRLGPRGAVMSRPAAPPPEGQVRWAAAEFYANLGHLGLRFGPTFVGIDEVSVASGLGLAHITVPEALRGEVERWSAHPALLDIFFQSMGGFVMHESSSTGALDTMLPTQVKRLVFHRPLRGSRATAYTRLEGAGDGASTASTLIVGEDGEPVVEVETFTVKRLGRDMVVDELPSWLSQVQWRAAPTPEVVGEGRTVALEGVDAALAEALRRRGAASAPVEQAAAWAVVASSVDGVLAAVRRLVALARPPRLYVLVASPALDAPADLGLERAGLAGLLRSLAYEHAELRPTLVEHDGGWDAVARELLEDGAETHVRLRGGERMVARLGPATLTPSAAEVSLEGPGTHLVVGGLGGLGLELARYLVARGARRVVLAGRSAPSAEARALMATLAAEVRYEGLDVTRADEVEALVGRLPDLRGVYHLAVVLDDGAARELDAARVARVWGPKVLGAVNLHHATRGRALEQFVLMSSAAAYLGTPGQASYAAANAALDALAERRAREGLPALAVALGVLEQAHGQAARLAERGAAVMRPEFALRALGRLMSTPRLGAVGVYKVELARWAQYYPVVARVPYFGVQAPASTASAEVRERLAQAPRAQRAALIEAHIREEVGRVLRLPPARFEPARSWASYGIDSLMGLEIRNRLEASLALTLPAILLYAEPTLAALSAHLLAKIEASLAPTPATPADAPAPAAPAAPAVPVEQLTDDQAAQALERRLAALRGKRR